MRFASLGSGSRGNATLVEAGTTRILVDCGFPARETERRLRKTDVDPETLDGILVTHEHSDHIGGLGAFARRYRLTVWMTAGTRGSARCDALEEVCLFSSHDPSFSIGNLRIQPFPVPHDAREPSQFTLRHNGSCLGILTDTGSITPHIVDMVKECDGLMLECNHDPDMLATGPYPPALQRRVGGAFGHLSNNQAARLVSRLDSGRLRHLVAAHLSQKNNTPEQVRQTLLAVDDRLEGVISLTTQDRVSEWYEL